MQQARHDWRESQHRAKEFGGRELPSKQTLKAIVDDLCGILFPMRLGPPDLRQESEDFYIAHTLDQVLNALFEQIKLTLFYEMRYRAQGTDQTNTGTASIQNASIPNTPIQNISLQKNHVTNKPINVEPTAS